MKINIKHQLISIILILVGMVTIIGSRDIHMGLDKQADLISELKINAIHSCSNPEVRNLLGDILSNSNASASSLGTAINVLAVLFIGIGVINVFIMYKHGRNNQV